MVSPGSNNSNHSHHGMRFYSRHRVPRLHSDRLQNRMNFWGFNSPPARQQQPEKTTVWSVLRSIISFIRTILNPVFKFLQAKYPEQFGAQGFCSPGCCCGAAAATATIIVASVALGVGLGVGLTSGDPPFNITNAIRVTIDGYNFVKREFLLELEDDY